MFMRSKHKFGMPSFCHACSTHQRVSKRLQCPSQESVISISWWFFVVGVLKAPVQNFNSRHYEYLMAWWPSLQEWCGQEHNNLVYSWPVKSLLFFTWSWVAIPLPWLSFDAINYKKYIVPLKETPVERKGERNPFLNLGYSSKTKSTWKHIIFLSFMFWHSILNSFGNIQFTIY